MLHKATEFNLQEKNPTDCFRKYIFIGCLVLLLSTITLKPFAQEVFTQPQSKFITTFPFIQLTGGIVIVTAGIDNNKDSLNFVLDTGSGGISLDSAVVAALGFTTEKSDKIIRGIAGTKNVDYTRHHTLKFPGLTVPDLDFHINDYDLLSSVYGVKIDGIIGFSFLRRFIVQIDYDSMQLKIYTPGSFKYPKGGYMLHPNFSSLVLQQIPVSDEREAVARYILDTGAGLCMLFSADFVNDSSLIKKKRRRYPTQAEGLGGKKTMELTVIKQVDIGPFKFRKVPVYIFSDDYNVTQYPLMAGLLGNDLLRRFNVVLNYPEQSIYIKPNTHFNDFFDYSYTGLGLYNIDNRVRVVDVMPGSPGDKAGFKTDDIIFAIDTNFTNNIQTYKSILQNAGSKVKIFVIRDNQPITLTLQIKNILRK